MLTDRAMLEERSVPLTATGNVASAPRHQPSGGEPGNGASGGSARPAGRSR